MNDFINLKILINQLISFQHISLSMASISLFPYSVVQQISPLARGNPYKRIYSTKTTRITVNAAESHVRRSANYEPSSWSFDHIQSLSSKYTVRLLFHVYIIKPLWKHLRIQPTQGDDYVARANTLKDAVKTMIRKAGNLLRTLELVDELQRLGISYLFEEEINNQIFCHNKPLSFQQLLIP